MDDFSVLNRLLEFLWYQCWFISYPKPTSSLVNTPPHSHWYPVSSIPSKLLFMTLYMWNLVHHILSGILLTFSHTIFCPYTYKWNYFSGENLGIILEFLRVGRVKISVVNTISSILTIIWNQFHLYNFTSRIHPSYFS